MISQPVLLLAALSAMVGGTRALSRSGKFHRLFDVLPVPLWCYMLPMLGTAAGLFPASSPLYGFLSKWALPVCLVWILLGVDVRALRGVGGMAGKLMASGTAGMMAGAVAAAFLLRHRLPAESWKSLGALSATWTGGSANMMAVKEALSVPDAVFAPVVVTDGLFTYGWMSFLVMAAAWQAGFDRWSGAVSDGVFSPEMTKAPGPAVPFAPTIVLGAAGAAAAVLLAGVLPGFGGAMTPATWAVLLSTTGALAAATLLSHGGQAVPEKVEKTGSFLLLILMASMGARATVDAAARAPWFLAAGAMMLLCHALALLAAARIFRAPLALAATASQACLGGVISAPMVGAVYRPALAAVGLLLAVAANAVGTYLGLATAILCRWVTT